MPNIHPFLVHFPVALLTTAFVFDLLGMLISRDELSRMGWWSQLAGTAGITAAVLSGLVAEAQAVIPPQAADTFDIHQQVAFLATGAFAALFLWRVGMRTKIEGRSRLVFLVLYALSLLLLWVGAWYGGELVYRHGVGLAMLP